MPGTLNAILATVRLPPAEAMRPPAPGRYRRTLLERLGIQAMPPALRMIVRTMERRPLRTALSITGVAAAVAIVIMGNFVRDAIDVVVDTQLRLGLRGDVTLWTADPVDDAVRHELARLPGVTMVEATRFVPVVIVNGHRRERSLIRGYSGRPELYRIIDVDAPRDAARRPRPGAHRPARRQARRARRRPRRHRGARGSRANARDARRRDGARDDGPERLHGAARPRPRRSATATSRRATCSRSSAAREAGVLDASKALPRVAGAWSKATMLRNMEEISARNVRIMSTVLTVFAAIIAVGVVYNNARIALAERAWELASLRVLGFTRAEVSALLLGELASGDRDRAADRHAARLGPDEPDHRAAEIGPVLFSGRHSRPHLRVGGAVRRRGRRRERAGRAPPHRPARHGGGLEDEGLR